MSIPDCGLPSSLSPSSFMADRSPPSAASINTSAIASRDSRLVTRLRIASDQGLFLVALLFPFGAPPAMLTQLYAFEFVTFCNTQRHQSRDSFPSLVSLYCAQPYIELGRFNQIPAGLLPIVPGLQPWYSYSKTHTSITVWWCQVDFCFFFLSLPNILSQLSWITLSGTCGGLCLLPLLIPTPLDVLVLPGVSAPGTVAVASTAPVYCL